MYSFGECQKFRQWWLWLLLVVICAVELYFFIYHNGGGHTIYRALGMIVALVVCIFFFFIRLETNIDGTGIQYRFFPVQLSYRKIDWSEVAEVYVRKYSPLGEYGGWGIRMSAGKNGWAYNIAGNMGLQIVKRDGKKLLIGTQKPDELKALLQHLAGDKIITGSINKERY